MELNEKLARRYGFTHHIEKNIPVVFVDGVEPRDFFDFEYWTEPNSDEMDFCPDFTHSLDACFKWLVPRISHYLMHRTANGHYAECVGIRGETGSAEAETAPLALCLAIERLIEGG